MKNLMILSVSVLLFSCGTVNEEPEVVITDTTDTTTVDVVSDTTTVNTFDPTGISNVQELLDTLANMPEGTVIED